MSTDTAPGRIKPINLMRYLWLKRNVKKALTVVSLLALSGCSFSYSFNPRGQRETFSKQEIAQALKERDEMLQRLAIVVSELQKAKEKKK
jgi:hypothetical protein